MGTSPEITRHFIELRGIGIIDVKTLYGVECVRKNRQIDLVIKLEELEKGGSYGQTRPREEYGEYLRQQGCECHSLPSIPGT